MAPRLTLHEVAERLGVHYMTAYRYVRTGRLPAERDGVTWLVDPADVRRMRQGGRRSARRSAARNERPATLAQRMVAGDEAGAWQIVEGALAGGAEPSDIHLRLLVPALEAVGSGWEEGALSVADEHRASGVAVRIVGRLGPRFARRGRKRGAVVLGAPAGELHALPSAILADVLRGAGFEVTDLGADTPAESFVSTARQTERLVAVALGATTLGRDRAVRAVVRALRASEVDAPVLLGGAAILDDAHARRLGADGWTGPDARAAVAAIERIAGERGPRRVTAARPGTG
jgi:excisionase family DNA binding protein